MSFHPVMKLADLWEGEMLGAQVEGRKILLIHIQGQIVAFEDRCAHLAVPMSRGKLEGTTLTCCAHQWKYHALTGQGLNPASVGLKPFPVRISGEYIEVDLPVEVSAHG